MEYETNMPETSVMVAGWGRGGVVMVLIIMMITMIKMTMTMMMIAVMVLGLLLLVAVVAAAAVSRQGAPAEVASLKLPATTEEQLTTVAFTILTLYLNNPLRLHCHLDVNATAGVTTVPCRKAPRLQRQLSQGVGLEAQPETGAAPEASPMLRSEHLKESA